MSKYYKVDDVSRAIIELPNAENGYSDSYDKAEILNAIESLPTIEVSEDCISSEWLLNFFVEFPDDYTLTIGNLRAVINDAPSVVPTAEQSCDTCKHNKLKWFSEECDGCTNANSNWERIEECL